MLTCQEALGILNKFDSSPTMVEWAASGTRGSVDSPSPPVAEARPIGSPHRLHRNRSLRLAPGEAVDRTQASLHGRGRWVQARGIGFSGVRRFQGGIALAQGRTKDARSCTIGVTSDPQMRVFFLMARGPAHNTRVKIRPVISSHFYKALNNYA